MRTPTGRARLTRALAYLGFIAVDRRQARGGTVVKPESVLGRRRHPVRQRL